MSGASLLTTGGHRVRLELVLVSAAWLARLGVLLAAPATLSGDSAGLLGYVEAARQIAETGRLPDLRTAPHGFAVLLAPVLVSVGIEGLPRFMLFAHILMDVVVVSCLLRLNTRIFDSSTPSLQRWRVPCAVAIILQPYTATMVNAVYTEQLSQLVIFAAIWILARSIAFPEKHRISSVSSVLLGVSAVLRVEMLAFGAAMLTCRRLLFRTSEKPGWSIRFLLLELVLFSILPCSMAGYQYWSTGEVGLVRAQFYFPGYMAWMRTWFATENDQHNRLAFGLADDDWPGFDERLYPARAFDSEDERIQIMALLRDWETIGYISAVDRGFAEIATSRRRSRPFRSFVAIPLLRMLHYWVSVDGAQTYLRSLNISRPISTMIVGAVMLFRIAIAGLAAFGAWAAWASATNAGDHFIVTFVKFCSIAVVLRTLMLGILGIQVWAGLMESRYVSIVFPLVVAMCAFGVASLLRRVVSARFIK